MKKILREHTVATVSALVVVFVVIIVSFYGWGISYLIAAMNKVNSGQSASGSVQHFDIKDASQLNYHGTLPQS
jgi:hypothetical protein